MKKYFAAGIFIVLLLTVITHVMAETEKHTEKPTVEARGAILVDLESGRILWGKNQDDELAMASTTKIMTAMLCLELGNLNDIVTVSRRAAVAPRVKMYLQEGEKIKLELLLYALMLQSSNDAAVAIAEHISGTVEEFCALMTAKAKELGAENTVFETPNGLDAGDHHSTASDLAIITRYAMKNDKFVKIINTHEYSGQSSRRDYHIYNKNRLLSEYRGANGVKTGFTGKAGYCFVGSAERDDLSLISVVLASGWGGRGREQRWNDTKEILNYGFNNYKNETIVVEGDTAGNLIVERSKTTNITLVFSEKLRLPITEEEKGNLRMERDLPSQLRAPITAGNVVGTCTIYAGEEKLAEIDVITTANAERHDLKTSMEKVLASLLEIFTSGKVDVVLPEF
ncbi:MAG: D-alanyl-D-alanine carboxypeptidase [Defluviitaleaceae bacterium]|nr:D-alanyl-D-alanine carboxypeptidase [Defluviitaleaceae bacterium]